MKVHFFHQISSTMSLVPMLQQAPTAAVNFTTMQPVMTCSCHDSLLVAQNPPPLRVLTNFAMHHCRPQQTRPSCMFQQTQSSQPLLHFHGNLFPTPFQKYSPTPYRNCPATSHSDCETMHETSARPNNVKWRPTATLPSGSIASTLQPGPPPLPVQVAVAFFNFDQRDVQHRRLENDVPPSASFQIVMRTP